MNQFKFLDHVYNSYGLSEFGEIVTVSVNFSENGWAVPALSNDYFGKRLSVYWKRKTSAVPASVNAFHMHRGLCSDLRETPWFWTLSIAKRRMATKLLALAVAGAYVYNARTNSQAMNFEVNVTGTVTMTGPLNFSSTPSAVMLEAARGSSAVYELQLPIALYLPIESVKAVLKSE